MVKHRFHFDDFTLGFFGDFMDYGFQPFGNVGGQNLPAVLWAEDDVILAGVGDIVV